MNSIEDRYLDQPYELAGRLIDPIGGSTTYRDQRHPLNRKLLEVLACLVSANDAMVARKTFIDLVWNGNALVGETGWVSSRWKSRVSFAWKSTAVRGES